MGVRDLTRVERPVMRAAWLVIAVAACGARTELDGPRPDAALDAASDLSPDFAWYRLDETSGSIAHDSTANHYDVDVGNVAWGEGATFVQNCGAASVAASFRVAPVTITAWLTPALRADESANAYALTPFPPNALSGDVPALGGFGMGLDVWGGGNALAVETGTNASIAFHSIAGSYSPGTRHFVAIVIDAASASLYVDGAQLTPVTADTPPPSAPTPLRLGCHNDDTGYGTKRFYNGRMRDVRVYKRLLQSSEIAALHANGPV